MRAEGFFLERRRDSVRVRGWEGDGVCVRVRKQPKIHYRHVWNCQRIQKEICIYGSSLLIPSAHITSHNWESACSRQRLACSGLIIGLKWHLDCMTFFPLNFSILPMVLFHIDCFSTSFLQLNNAPLFGICRILFVYSPGWFISISNSGHSISLCWLNADPWEACSWQVPGPSCWWERFLVLLAAAGSSFETLSVFLCSHIGWDPGKSRCAGKLALKDTHPGPSCFHCLIVKQSQR